ncbi:MAG: hypothetical protein EPO26_14970 [Chloroflexota bacterium]|nr:MAG: hypothetical protein EPO26_14970 [Chloroflexota bacterium]
MRTTVELRDELVAEAKAVLGGPSLRAIIEESLEAAIAHRHREDLRKAIREREVFLDTTDEQLADWRRDGDFS